MEKPTYEELERKVQALEEQLENTKQVEKLLQEKEYLYRLLFDRSPDGILIIDPATGHFFDFNETAHLQLGYSREEFSRLSIFDLEVDESAPEIQKHLEDIVKHGFSDFESRHYTRQGEIRNIHITAQHTEVWGKKVFHAIWRDITERKRIEKALRESEIRLADIFNFLPDPTFAVDLSGKVIAWNRAVEEMTGVKAKDMLGKSDHEYIIPFYGTPRPVLIDLVFKSDEELEKKYSFIKREGNAFLAEAEVPLRGEPHTLWGIAGPLYDSNGNIVGAIESVRDITDRKRMEEDLRKAHDELEMRVKERTAELMRINAILRNEILERERTETVLKESRQKFAVTFYKSPIPMALTSMKDGRYIDVNEAFMKVMGLKYEELVGKTSTHVGYISKESRAIFLEEFYQKGVVENLELSICIKGDERRRGLFNSSKIIIGDEDFCLTMVTDITDLRKMEKELRQSEEMLDSVFKAAPVSLCIAKNRICQRINKALRETFGYSEAETIGQTTRFLFENEEEYERVGQKLYANLASSDSASVSTRLLRKDGIPRDVIVTAVPLKRNDASFGEIVAIEDVTDRKRADEELQRNRRELEDIIEFLPDATVVIDKQSRVIAWNRAMEKMTGVKKEDILGKGDYEYALPFHGERRPVLIDYALHPEKAIEIQYTTFQRVGDILLGEAFTPNLPRGNIHVSATASVLRDNKGEVVSAIECVRDNTERKKLEERLNRAQKMEALGTLAGGVAHDLNNVLGVVVGFAEMLDEQLPHDNSLKEYADNILQSSLRGVAIIQDLLTLARRGVISSEVLNLNNIIESYLRTPEFVKLKSHHSDVKISAKLQKGLLNIKGSPIHLNKTIMNLILNAAESISSLGGVMIRTENRYLDKPIKGYDDVKEGDYVVLTISDTGKGISPNDLGKIFEPFYTKKVMGRSGTGLGLAVVWGTVKDHNGYIDVQSSEGIGTTFTLYFPVTREEPATAEKVLSPLTYMGKGESILVVDDVKEQRKLAISMLSRLGYQVEAVAGGEEAIEYLRNNKADLIVLDMIMDPGIDGMETFRQIVEINPKQKAIIVSGFSETDRVKKVQEMGAGAFIRKPYILSKIGPAIRKELDRK